MAQEYGIVLSDSLYKAYNQFTHSTDGENGFDKNLIKKLLSYFKKDILTNTEQIKRTGALVSHNLTSALAKSGFKRQSLEELAQRTIFKIILCTDEDQFPEGFPYVNINKDRIENNLTATFHQSEPRDKAIEHLKALCAKASVIGIYDKYFSNIDSNDNIKTLTAILPQKKLKISYPKTPLSNSSTMSKPLYLSEEDIAELKSNCADWTFEEEDRSTYFHDRYLTIDHKIEIILTSGFEHLGGKTKDFTYVVRVLR